MAVRGWGSAPSAVYKFNGILTKNNLCNAFSSLFVPFGIFYYLLTAPDSAPALTLPLCFGRQFRFLPFLSFPFYLNFSRLIFPTGDHTPNPYSHPSIRGAILIIHIFSPPVGAKGVILRPLVRIFDASKKLTFSIP